MIKFMLIAAMAVMACAGCRTPSVNAGYYIDNKTDSKTTVLIGTNNTQANAIHAGINPSGNSGDVAEANEAQKTAKSSGLFVNNNVGDRSADIDTSAALELLKDVAASTASANQTKGAESAVDNVQNPVNAPTHNIPLAVSKEGATATVDNAGE